jgi:hypothetical protein
MKKFGLILLSLIALGGIGYILGPKPVAPKLETPIFKLTGDLPLLESQIKDGEMETPGLRPGCEAKIVWADSSKKIKTKIAFLYIHGFSATSQTYI